MFALVVHAHQPVLAASAPPGRGVTFSEWRALSASAETLDDGRPSLALAPYLRAHAAGLEPLGAASLGLSLYLFSEGDGGDPRRVHAWVLRVENLLIFAAVAAGVGVLLRRWAASWVGDDHARAAAWAGAALCMVHPLAFAAGASIDARGDLIALALASFAAARYLGARQRRQLRGIGTAVLLFLAAAFASRLCLGFALLFGLAEFLAVRRHRPFATRLRSSLSAWVAFLALAWTPSLLRAAFAEAGTAAAEPNVRMTERAAIALEKLGVLALPVDTASLSFVAYLVVAALLVIAIEPALSAARLAPRSWSWIVGVGAVVVLLASAFGAPLRVRPDDFTHARLLLPGIAAVCAGLALSSTALTGLRRSLVPAILATAFAAMTHEHAASWSRALRGFDGLRSEIDAACASSPPAGAVVVLDLPTSVEGFTLLDRSVGLAGLSPDPARWVAVASRQAFAQFTRTGRFAELRENGVRVVMDAPDGAPGERWSLDLPRPAASGEQRRWFREGASSALDWDSLTLRSVHARGPRGTDVARDPFLGFDAAGIDGKFRGGELRGVWIDSGGEPRACFDVGSSLAWLCSQRVRLAWPVAGWSDLSDADASDDLPRFDVEPSIRAEGDDWRFTMPSSVLMDAGEATLARRGERGTLRLTLLDLETLELAEFSPEIADDGRTRVAAQAGRIASRWTARGRQIAWCLEYVASGVAIVRAEGLTLPR